MKKIISALFCFVTVSANAAIITSTGDAALSGAEIHTFDAVGSGDYSSLVLAGSPNVTIIGNGATMTVDTSNSMYGIGGKNLHNSSSSPNSFDILFSNAVSAFGIYAGAVNNSWVYTAYDANNNVLESITTSGACCSPMFYGIANNAGISRVTLNGFGDWAIFDNLYVVGKKDNEVPEPVSLALLGLGLAGLTLARRRKQ